MLIQFSVENFGSFAAEQSLSLVASNYYKGHDENTYEPHLPGLSGVRILKAAAVFGPNASGKSMLIKAIARLRGLVCSPLSADPKSKILYSPNVLADGYVERPTKFHIAFVQDGVRYEYALHHTGERVILEELSAFPHGRKQLWFRRTWQAETESYKWYRPSGNLKLASEILGMVSETSLLLSIGSHLNNVQLKGVFGWFLNELKIVNMSAGPTEPQIDPSYSIELLQRSAEHRAQFLSLLRCADLGVVDAQVEQVETPPEVIRDLSQFLQPEVLEAALGSTQQQPVLSHAAARGSTPIRYADESEGTRRLFSLAGPWLDILGSGHVALIDELDASLHPQLVVELLRLVFSERTNPNGAQVIFTTHSPHLLAGALLRRDQIWFTEKDMEGATRLYPLSDFRPRPNESLVNGYLAGRYGAIPCIPSCLGLQ